MGDVQISKDEMNTLAGYLSDSADYFKTMKGHVEKMRNNMANLYDGQAKDNLNTCFTKIESQLILLQNSCNSIKKHVNSTKKTLTDGDTNASSRANTSIDYNTSSSSGNSSDH